MSASVAAVLASALVLAPATASASNATATFVVSTTVANTCTIAATALTFAAYVPSSATADNGSSTITVNCTNDADYTVALNAGQNGTVAARKMINGTYTLGYQLYTTNGYATVWGDGSGSSVTQAGTGTGANQTLTVYGQIPINEAAINGTYSDTVTATITY